MKIIVTGSSGFIGSNCVAAWTKHHEVVTVDKVGCPDVLTDMIGSLVEDERFIGADAVVHLASKSNVAVEPGDEDYIVSHNLALAAKAHLWCRRYRIPILIHASSSAVYGDHDVPPYKEDSNCEPLSAYGHSKLFSEHLLNDLGDNNRSPQVVSFRLFNAIGDFQKSTMLPWIAMRASETKQPVTLFGRTLRSWTSVKEIVRVFEHVACQRARLKDKHTIVNLGLDNPMSQTELFDLMRSVAPEVSVPYVMGERRSFEMFKTQPDLTLFRSLMGTEMLPTVTALREAVSSSISWYKRQQFTST